MTRQQADSTPFMSKMMDWQIEQYIEFNEMWAKDDFLKYSEEFPYNIEAMKIWIAIRDNLTYVDNENEKGNWRTLQITKSNGKYGIYYVFIDIDGWKWRVRRTASEFYGRRPQDFKIEDLY